MSSIDFFKENKFVVIKNHLTNDMCNLFYRYACNKVKAIDYKYNESRDFYAHTWDGNWHNDQQTPGEYSCYGDILMDTLLELSTPVIKDMTGIDVFPTYSYWRLYTKNSELKKHLDRPSCEISTTLCLGMDTSNIDKEIYPNYVWPIWVDDKPINLQPGDMLIYKGCEVEHWREPYMGLNHAQVFLHYNDKNGNNDNYYDGRDLLGVPKNINKPY